jgi:hypothetical protein
VKALDRVFRSTTATGQEMQVQVSRLSVLYEDLRIEWSGAEQEELQPLDHTSIETRRFYFVRRTLATLAEIEGALHKLNSNQDFRTLKKGFSPAASHKWDEIIKFFSNKHAFLKDWRNDVGGHFLDAAAEYSLANVHPSTVGAIDLYRSGEGGADVKMPFAYELVAIAMTKGKANNTEEQFLSEAFTFLKDAATYAVDAIQILVNEYLYDRFI